MADVTVRTFGIGSDDVGNKIKKLMKESGVKIEARKLDNGRDMPDWSKDQMADLNAINPADITEIISWDFEDRKFRKDANSIKYFLPDDEALHHDPDAHYLKYKSGVGIEEIRYFHSLAAHPLTVEMTRSAGAHTIAGGNPWNTNAPKGSVIPKLDFSGNIIYRSRSRLRVYYEPNPEYRIFVNNVWEDRKLFTANPTIVVLRHGDGEYPGTNVPIVKYTSGTTVSINGMHVDIYDANNVIRVDGIIQTVPAYLSKNDARKDYIKADIHGIPTPEFVYVVKPGTTTDDIARKTNRAVKEVYYYTIVTGARGAPSQVKGSTAVLWGDLKKE